jgi:rhamnosyltransferase
MISGKTCAVIVTFQPDTHALLKGIGALSAQVDGIVVVDNASAELEFERIFESYPSLVLRKFGTNRGIGAAQNEGIAAARAGGFRHVLLLDQDSVPQAGMVDSLRRALERLVEAGRRVACVGSRVRFPGSTDLSTFASSGWLRQTCRDHESIVECDAVMSSGTFIPLDVIEAVGGMEEALFIDQVDTEWCLRARSQGYGVFGACGAILEHRLGETAQRVWAGRWRRLPRHKPFRYYYIFRNTILVSRRPYVSAMWVLFSLRRLAVLFLAYGLFTTRRMGELRMMVKGTLHGIRGVSGKLEEQ